LETFHIPFSAMASTCEVALYSPDRQTAEQQAKVAIDEVRRIEQKYSRYSSGSWISEVNAAAGLMSVDCDQETLALLDFAEQLYDRSQALFDITSGLLRRAWDFKHATLPSKEVLAKLCQLVDARRVLRNGSNVKLAQIGMEIDFGGFGKEYAADRAATRLADEGVLNGYVNLAGDIRVMGPKMDGTPWLMGIQDPRNPAGIFATIPMSDGALATSGDYERYFELDGRRYCHLLHPKTGMPVGYWQSVSVLAPLAIVAGGCSTIAMLLEEAGIDFLARSGFGYIAIDQRGNVFQS
jgi:thiamine biosynthesis lipoprotein